MDFVASRFITFHGSPIVPFKNRADNRGEESRRMRSVHEARSLSQNEPLLIIFLLFDSAKLRL